MFTVKDHLWRTNKGDLVPTGHEDAAILAYPAGTELTDDEAEKQGLLKAKPKPHDKAASQSSNKAAEKAPASQK